MLADFGRRKKATQMRTIEAERFPEATTMLAERFGDVTEDLHGKCTKCGHDKDDGLFHVPEFLGGGCIDHDGSSLCPECGEPANHCADWCSLARVDR
jgi:hypothetical protein